MQITGYGLWQEQNNRYSARMQELTAGGMTHGVTQKNFWLIIRGLRSFPQFFDFLKKVLDFYMVTIYNSACS